MHWNYVLTADDKPVSDLFRAWALGTLPASSKLMLREIVHIGQAVLTMGGTMEYFRDTVFNYPTLAEAYKVAALDGLNKL